MYIVSKILNNKLSNNNNYIFAIPTAFILLHFGIPESYLHTFPR